MLTFKPITQPILDNLFRWTAQRAPWLKRFREDAEYYYNDVEGTGTNYTKQQLEKIQSVTNIPVTINSIHPITNQKLALLVRGKPSHRVVATDNAERSKKFAALLDKMKHAVMYNSDADSKNELACKDMLIGGMGNLMSVPQDFYQPGEFEIAQKYLSPDEVILDGNAKDVNLTDMEGFFIEREMTLSKAKNVYSGLLSAVQEAAKEYALAHETTVPEVTWEMLTGGATVSVPFPGGTATVDANYNAQKLVVREYYEKVYSTMYFVEDADSGDIHRIFEENARPESFRLLVNAKTPKEENVFVRKTLILGNYIVSEETLPLTAYPLQVAVFEWGGSPYKSYGMIHFLKGMQEAKDKFIQLMILNGILQNNAGWTAPKGSIAETDKAQWEARGNDPAYVKEYVPKVYEGGVVLKPERDRVEPLSNFYPLAIQMMDQGMEFSSGVNQMLQGDPKAGVDVFASLQQYQTAAMQRVILAASHFNMTMTAMGRVVTEYLLANVKPERNYQFFDDSGNEVEIMIAREMIKDFKKVPYRVLSTPAQAQPSQRMAIATELFKVAQTAVDPAERKLFIDKAIKLSDIPEMDDIMEELDTIKQLQGAVSGMEEQMKRDKELMKQWENKALNAEYQAKLYQMLMQGSQTLVEKQAVIESQLDLKKKELDAEARESE